MTSLIDEKRHNRFLVGIDEAGRGPLAGPVAVGVVKITDGFDWNLLPGVNDSKLLSPEQRRVIFDRAQELKRAGMLDFAVASSSARQIDEFGIVRAIKLAMGRAIRRLALTPDTCFIKLDGALAAPRRYEQVTIIKGDQSELVIGLASIVAKETRDAYMLRIAKQFAAYDFHLHKGYGTRAHRRAITEHGLSSEHRLSYCQNRHEWGKV